MRLAIKIPLFIFVGCLVAGAAGSVFLAAGQATEIRGSFERRNEGLVRSVGAMGASMMAANPPDDRALQQAVDNLEEFGHGAAHGIEWLAFVDCGGRVVAHSDPRRFGTALHEVPAEWLRCGPADAVDHEPGLRYEGSRLLVAASVRLETRSGTVAASFSLADVEAQEASGRRTMFLSATGFAAALAVALSLVLRAVVARRLTRLADDTRALRDGELERRSTLAGRDEVGQLAASFNAMAERLASHARHLEDEVRARTKELERANRELERLATTDPLTGLFNRRRMEEILDEAIAHHERKGRTLSVVMIDLDHFKRFNDTHGHLAGDALLRELGGRLRARKRLGDTAARLSVELPTTSEADDATARGSTPPETGAALPERMSADASAARYGGEEFLLILPETSKADALLVAERARAAIEQAQLVTELRPNGRITLSAGVASFPEDGNNHDALLRAADAALYASKHAGRNRVMAAPAEAPGLRITRPPSASPGGKP